MRNSDIHTDDKDILVRLELKARELDSWASETPSRIVRAVAQGQAQILREVTAELRACA
ncbi:hypothetical protein [Sphingomonas sp. CROZ-RG-20F-R02-07]|uniref:hypothetical protein n=1 Tax=Sphingomonas sp. CROZ-RG-20F-R02-07 TaxID=2914832 RepID=UPI001F5760C5|nr:hypothetical protein [Sphingomonas sp. CROZ-RG-20F-R02-07]